ncbi:LysR family transcriptional regulator [Dyella caseinilytica]|uniref:LysR family transcriptional regulator n=1 Tax=Dyella caseinilytica TaxID=1849581 RepID=A0ABX7GNZ7_9GAMM|nr:LysR family transcriptional regulator [Dyella caseinilytica]QRN52150.1 LysR family transcriptional regulator [Dyella caseinilytica]GGA13713.1 LysR family transcriptional regulator [Dyella caseinilytica]
MRDHYALRAFRAIAEHGSFTRAAATLDVTPSALSQTVQQLETQLGTRLLQRTTRRVGLTEAGQEMLQRIAPALNELDQAIDAIRQHADRPRGTLRITVPVVVSQTIIEPMLGEFMARWPDVQLDIRVDNGFSDLVAEGLDAGIRLGERVQRDMVAVPLGSAMRGVVVGSPAYFKRCGYPKTPKDLQNHQCIKYRMASSGAIYRWEFAHRSGPKKGCWYEIAVDGSLTVNDISLALRAAEDGIGMISILEISARAALDAGRLESVLDPWLPPFEGFYLYYPSRFQVPPKLRVFIDFIREWTQRGTMASTLSRALP